jgi:hypothetical protein
MGGTAASRLNSFGSSGTTLGAIGGAQAQTIAQANLPNVTFAGAALSVSASGSYSGTTATESNGHTHTFSGNTGAMSANATHSHSVTYAIPSLAYMYYQGGSQGGQAGTVNTSSVNLAHTHPFSGTTSDISATHTHTYSGTVSVGGSTSAQAVSSGGSGTALATVQPTVILPRILRVL